KSKLQASPSTAEGIQQRIEQYLKENRPSYEESENSKFSREEVLNFIQYQRSHGQTMKLPASWPNDEELNRDGFKVLNYGVIFSDQVIHNGRGAKGLQLAYLPENGIKSDRSHPPLHY